ncbi:MAG TPA: hypothetical protein VGH28_32230 [Polyangiaceae bacterium]|jgi:hypothetical protein
MKRTVSFLLASASLVLLFAECKPSAGGDCTENAKSCDTPTSRFACVNGKYAAQTCKGPGGCKEEKGTTSCDTSKGDVGDPCASENASVCSVDGKSHLRCDQGKLILVSRCNRDGCTTGDNGEGHCGWPFANEGDTCKPKPGAPERASGACTEDNKGEMRCKDGKMTKVRACRGEEGCVPLTTGPWCDRSVGQAGDDCDPAQEEFSVACEASHDTMLTCKGGKLGNPVRCGGEGKCYVRTYGKDGFSHYQAECDQSLAKAGEACVKEGGPACSDDLKSKLVCQMGKFVVDTPCKKGCLVHAPDGTTFQCAENAAKAISGGK